MWTEGLYYKNAKIYDKVLKIIEEPHSDSHLGRGVRCGLCRESSDVTNDETFQFLNRSIIFVLGFMNLNNIIGIIRMTITHSIHFKIQYRLT